MKVKLLSFAHNEPFASTLALLNASAAHAGFDEVQLWNMDDFLRVPLFAKLRPRLQALQRYAKRPYCDAFKMISLLHAMERSSDGDYLLWCDSSRHFPYPLRGGSVHAAITRLNEGASEPRSLYGRINCVGNWGVPEAEVPITTTSHPASAFAPYFARQKPVLGAIIAAQILLANTRRNRQLVREWLNMAVHQPKAFCGHASEDNFAWIALVCNHSLPSLVNQPTLQLESSPSHFAWAPLSAPWLLETLEAGAYKLVPNACGGQSVRDACRAWLHDPRSRKLRLRDRPMAFPGSPGSGTCSSDAKFSAAITRALETGAELQMRSWIDFTRPCTATDRRSTYRTARTRSTNGSKAVIRKT